MRLWEVGHVGVFDLLQQYWPVAYQIAKGKQGRNSCATAQLRSASYSDANTC